MESLIPSKTLQAILLVLIAFILLGAFFAIGVNVGERKARHFSSWSNHRGDMFGGPPAYDDRAPRGMMPMRGMPNPHGAFGKVLSVDGTKIILQGNDNLEQTIIMTSSTAVRAENSNATAADIKTDLPVGVFGEPNSQGQIEARLIRIFPAK